MSKRKAPINIHLSIRDRLYDAARKGNREFNTLVRHYLQERLLFRLSMSIYADNFILKGAWLLIAYNIHQNRPTKDIDFLGVQIKSDEGHLKNVFKEIALIQYPDGVEFFGERITTEKIKEGAEYEGTRIHIPCKLGAIRNSLQIDIGYGDKMVFEPDKIEFPVILDFEAPILRVYSLESSIAEKFQSIVSLGLASSRMKDYFDIAYIARNKSFKLKDLSVALTGTFKKRGTDTADIYNIFSPEFKVNGEMNTMWVAFLSKRKIKEDANFSDTVGEIQKFLAPCFESISAEKVWNNNLFIWEDL